MSEGRNIVAAFEQCDPTKSLILCKIDAEIEEWLEFKYLLGVYNSKQFVSDQFG